MMKPTEKFQAVLYKEILGRIKQTDLSVPYKYGDYWYYTKTEEGKQYPLYCRKHESMAGEEQLTLDLNELAKGHQFLGLGLYKISDDGNLLLYSLDTTGFREYRGYVKIFERAKFCRTISARSIQPSGRPITRRSST